MEKIDYYSEQPYSSKIVKNTFYSGLTRLFGMLMGFFLTPYILAHLGIERFGVWSIVLVLTGYMSILDIGLSISFVRHISLYYAQEDINSLREVINSGLFFYIVINLLILGGIIILAMPILNLFNLSSDLKQDAVLVLILGVINLGLTNLFNVFNSILYGFQRLDVCFKIGALSSLPLITGVIFVLENGYGLKGLMYVYIFVTLVLLISGVISSYKILGNSLKIGFSYVKISMLKKLIPFGFVFQLNQLSQMINFHYDKILILYFLDIVHVVYYELGSKFVLVIRSIPSFLTSPIIPAASEIEVREGRDKVWELYIRGTKYLILVGIPIFLFVTLKAKDFILIWLGSNYPISVNVVRILSIGFFLSLICSMASSIVYGTGTINLELKRILITMVLNLLLSLILILRFGFLGAVFGTNFSLIIGSVYFLQIFKTLFEKSWKDILSKFLKPLVAGLIAMIFLFFIEAIFTQNILRTRIDTVISLAIEGLLFITVYSVIILITKYLDKYDKALIKEMIPKNFYGREYKRKTKRIL